MDQWFNCLVIRVATEKSLVRLWPVRC